MIRRANIERGEAPDEVNGPRCWPGPENGIRDDWQPPDRDETFGTEH
jgi:hypothetical protein